MLSNSPFCNSKVVSRRAFFRTSSLSLAAAGVSGIHSASTARAEDVGPGRSKDLIGKGETILFQGDSITDAGRSREHAQEANEQPGLGSGYAWLAAVELLVQRPNSALKIYNRGISGNKVFQLADRWQSDCLDLKPTLLSILIGVNDIWHALNGKYNGTVEI